MPKALIIGVWQTLLMMANESPVNGVVSFGEAGLLDNLKIETGLDYNTLVELTCRFQSLEMIVLEAGKGLRVIDWDKYQVKKTHRNSVEEIRKVVFARDSYRCVYCGGPAEHLDHIKPKSRGGPDVLTNLVASCARCNQSKRDKPWLSWYWKQSFFTQERRLYVVCVINGQVEKYPAIKELGVEHDKIRERYRHA